MTLLFVRKWLCLLMVCFHLIFRYAAAAIHPIFAYTHTNGRNGSRGTVRPMWKCMVAKWSEISTAPRRPPPPPPNIPKSTAFADTKSPWHAPQLWELGSRYPSIPNRDPGKRMYTSKAEKMFLWGSRKISLNEKSLSINTAVHTQNVFFCSPRRVNCCCQWFMTVSTIWPLWNNSNSVNKRERESEKKNR